MHREIITFEAGEQIFGLDIMAIREIRAWTPTTKLPHVPHYVKGVVNLRGTVLPVTDLAARLGWEETEPTPRHVIIVTQLGGQARGLIVEAVNDIVTLEADSLQPPPSSNDDDIAQFIEGLVAIEKGMVMVLNLEAINNDVALEQAA